MCPEFCGVGLLDFMLMIPRRGQHAQELPAGVRSKVLDLLKAGRTVAQIAHDLQISDQTIYTWRRQSLVDAGQEPGLTSVEKAELASARRRIAELETELAIHQRATELLKEAVRPRARFAAIAAMAQDGLSIQTAWECLNPGCTPGVVGRRRPARCGTPG
jgi:putative transposase